jgi:hypothetical protein
LSHVRADNSNAKRNRIGLRQRRNVRHDLRKALAEIAAVAGDQAYAISVAPRHDAEAVVLDLVQPVRTAGRSFGRRRQARLDEADRSGATL